MRLRIPGFAALTSAEQLQASALALNRDLSIDATSLKLAAVAAPGIKDEALVAFTTHREAGISAQPDISTHLFAAVQPGVVYWVGAPRGYVVGERGAAAVESSTVDETSLPSVVAATIASASSTRPHCILVERDRTAISDDAVAHWAAASGIEMVDGTLPAAAPVSLVSPPRSRETHAATFTDRALQWAAIAGVVCAAIASIQFAGMPAATAIQGSIDGKRAQSTAGALLERVAIAAPDSAGQIQSGTYAGGVWVLGFADSLDASTMTRMTRALQTNGLAAQSTAAPSPRLRVQLP